MKKALVKRVDLYHIVNDVKVDGPRTGLSGDCSGLSGNCSDLRGDLDECEITEEERATGVNIEELVS